MAGLDDLNPQNPATGSDIDDGYLSYALINDQLQEWADVEHDRKGPHTFDVGTVAQRSAASKDGRLYLLTEDDEQPELQYDTGSAWVFLTSNEDLISTVLDIETHRAATPIDHPDASVGANHIKEGAILKKHLLDGTTAIGPNLIVNGKFDINKWWTLGDGWTINLTTKKAESDGTQTDFSLLSQGSSMEAGVDYQITFPYTRTAGAARIRIDDDYLAGEVWDEQTPVAVGRWSSVLANNDDYALSSVDTNYGNGNKLLKSVDGKTWSTITNNLPADSYVTAMRWNGTIWMLCYVRGGHGYASTSSDDGVTWTTGVLLGSLLVGRGIEYYDSTWFICGTISTQSYTRWMKSTDDGVTIDTGMLDFAGAYDDYYSLAHNGTVLCAVGVSGEIITTSEASDYEVWEEQESGVSVQLRDIKVVGTMFIAVGGVNSGSNGEATILTSIDNGITWVEQDFPEDLHVSVVPLSIISVGDRLLIAGHTFGSGNPFVISSAGYSDWETVLDTISFATLYWGNLAYVNGTVIYSTGNGDGTACVFVTSEPDTKGDWFSDASGTISYDYTAVGTNDAFQVEVDEDFVGTFDDIEIRKYITDPLDRIGALVEEEITDLHEHDTPPAGMVLVGIESRLYENDGIDYKRNGNWPTYGFFAGWECTYSGDHVGLVELFIASSVLDAPSSGQELIGYIFEVDENNDGNFVELVNHSGQYTFYVSFHPAISYFFDATGPFTVRLARTKRAAAGDREYDQVVVKKYK